MNKILKISLALIMVVALIVIGTGTALAAPKTSVTTTSVKTPTVTLTGSVASKDLLARTFVVTTNKGDVKINVDNQTDFQIAEDKTGRLEDLKVGDKVVVTAKPATNGNLALIVRVLPLVLTGKVASKDLDTRTFVVTTNTGDIKIKVNDQTKFQITEDKTGRLEDLKVGDKVVVIAERTTDGNLALVVKVLPGEINGSVASKDFDARTFVVTTNTGNVTIKVNDLTKFQITGDKTGRLERIKVGDKVLVVAEFTTDGNLALIVKVFPAQSTPSTQVK
jgi:phage gp46-like protein